MSAFLLLVGGIVASWAFYNFVYKRWGLPPGPTPWPIMGNLMELEKTERYEWRFVEWKQKYGGVFTWWLGETPIVTVADYKLAQEMFVKDGDTYAQRIGGGQLQRRLRGDSPAAISGIFFAEGPLWKDQRQFILRVLRNFGLGRNEMELRIMDEVYHLVETVEEAIGGRFDMNNNEVKKTIDGAAEHTAADEEVDEIDFHRFTDLAVGSVINSLLFSYRYTEDGREAEFRQYKRMATRVIATFSEPLMGMALFNDTIAALIRPFMTKHMSEPFEEVFEFLDRNIEKHVAGLHVDVEAEPRNFVEAFVAEKLRLETAGDDRARFYTLKQLRNVCFDLWIAGQESSSSAITWCVAYLIRNPDVQRRLHDELDAKAGGGRWISVNDRTALVYTNAVILVRLIAYGLLDETLRCCNLLTNGNLRRTNRDVVVNGFRIPKDTCCYCQFATIHSDPAVFEDPRAFRPERESQ
ncbi:(pine wood nematode) hypothetical protein [Aphelenchoides fujianensis]|nr:(pine wood nematode) hypothetical protein [Aphelenchoides fujianensis]